MFVQFFKNHWKLLVLCLVAAVFMYIWVFFKRKDLKTKWWGCLLIVLTILIIGIVGQIGLAKIENLIAGENISNMRCFGALFLFAPFLAVYPKIAKTDYRQSCNILGVAAVIAWLFTRINCYVVGCCYGRLVSAESSFRYPVREVEMAWIVFFLAFFIPRVYENKKTVNLYYLYLFVYGCIRFVCDFLRQDVYELAPHFYLSQVWALAALVVGGIFLFLDVWKTKKAATSGGGH